MYNRPSIYNDGGMNGNTVILGQNFAVQTMEEADATNHYPVTNADNNGTVTLTAKTVPISFVLRRLGVHIIQGAGTSNFRLCVYTRAGVPVCRTAAFSIVDFGEKFFQVAELWNGAGWVAGSEVLLDGGQLYYFGIYCPQLSSAARFLGRDAGTTFGPKPWIAWTADNLGAGGLPTPMPAGFESSVRFLVIGAA